MKPPQAFITDDQMRVFIVEFLVAWFTLSLITFAGVSWVLRKFGYGGD